MTITEPTEIDPAEVRRDLRRASSGRFLFGLEVAAVVVVITYVTMLLTVRHSYSIDSVSLYNWWGSLALFLPVIPILVRRRNSSALHGAWLLLGLGILLFDFADVLR